MVNVFRKDLTLKNFEKVETDLKAGVKTKILQLEVGSAQKLAWGYGDANGQFERRSILVLELKNAAGELIHGSFRPASETPNHYAKKNGVYGNFRTENAQSNSKDPIRMGLKNELRNVVYAVKDEFLTIEFISDEDATIDFTKSKILIAGTMKEY
jgi:hypothetical protein